MQSEKRADRITLSGIRIFPRIGVTEEERSSAQECHADLTLWGDFEAAGSTDCLDESIDYCQVLAAVQDTAGAREYLLLEALAYAIVQVVLKNFPVSRTGVRIRKRPAILISQLDFVEIEMEGSPANLRDGLPANDPR